MRSLGFLLVIVGRTSAGAFSGAVGLGTLGGSDTALPDQLRGQFRRTYGQSEKASTGPTNTSNVVNEWELC